MPKSLDNATVHAEHRFQRERWRLETSTARPAAPLLGRVLPLQQWLMSPPEVPVGWRLVMMDQPATPVLVSRR